MTKRKPRKLMKTRWSEEGIIQLHQSLHFQGWYVYQEQGSVHGSDPHALQ